MGAAEIIFFNTTCGFTLDRVIRRSSLDNTMPPGQIPNNF